MIPRAIDIAGLCRPGKTLLVMGPRRSGKTTLLKQYLETADLPSVYYDGGNLSVQAQFSVNDIAHLRKSIEGFAVVALDEAQDIPHIGMSLKIINDHSPETIVIATGSSSFDLRGQVGEPLVGRKTTCVLYPLAAWELLGADASMPASVVWRELLPNLLRFGMYPDSVLANSDHEREEFLRELVDSLLLRDILMYQEIKGSGLLLQLLVLLAHQIGQEVSLSELGSSLGIRRETVARYLDLLEKGFVIFRLGGFSRNLRSEVTKKAKYFFYDIGVRNAVINNFNQLEIRNDVGQLWENFAIVERMKARAYKPIFANQYFWRTWKQSEIDLVEERGGAHYAYEMKLNPGKRNPGNTVRAPKEWAESYGDVSTFKVITPDNFLEFADYREQDE